MKVFCFDKTDWIAAETKEEAIEFWVEETGGMIKDSFVEEASLTETMWYGFEWDDKDIQNLIENTKREFKIKKDVRGDFSVAIELTFKETLALHGDKYKTPYLIASTEY